MKRCLTHAKVCCQVNCTNKFKPGEQHILFGSRFALGFVVRFKIICTPAGQPQEATGRRWMVALSMWRKRINFVQSNSLNQSQGWGRRGGKLSLPYHPSFPPPQSISALHMLDWPLLILRTDLLAPPRAYRTIVHNLNSPLGFRGDRCGIRSSPIARTGNLHLWNLCK